MLKAMCVNGPRVGETRMTSDHPCQGSIFFFEMKNSERLQLARQFGGYPPYHWIYEIKNTWLEYKGHDSAFRSELIDGS